MKKHPTNLHIKSQDRTCAITLPATLQWNNPSHDGQHNWIASQVRFSTLAGEPVLKTPWQDNQRNTTFDIDEGSLPLFQRLQWQVRLKDSLGKCGEWSPAVSLVIADKVDDTLGTQWLEPEQELVGGVAPKLSCVLPVLDSAAEVFIAVTSQGLYEASLNGQKIGTGFLTPGWTSYHDQHMCDLHDVTDLYIEAMQKNKPAQLDVLLGDGWWRGEVGWAPEGGYINNYGEVLRLNASIVMRHTDGSVTTLQGHELEWQANSMSQIQSASLYDGERWSLSPVTATQTKPKLVRVGNEHLEWGRAAYVESIEEVQPVSITSIDETTYLIDFGINLTGVCTLNVQNVEANTWTLRHGELLRDGLLYTENLCGAQQTDQLCHEDALEAFTFTPKFTFHGFRYVELKVATPLKDKEKWSLSAHVLSSNYNYSGHFECDHAGINQLFSNIVRGQKGNFIDVPLDCPQRNERLGWTADTQVFTPLALLNADCRTIYEKYLVDLRANQFANGCVPHVVPDIATINNQEYFGSAGWGDAVALIPEFLYQRYQDRQIIEDNYHVVAAWIDYRLSQTDGNTLIVRDGFHFGDWMAPSAEDNRFPYPVTDTDFITTAFLAKCIEIIHGWSQKLGLTADREKFGSLLTNIRQDIQDEFVSPNGRVAGNTQACYVLALAFNLLPEAKQTHAVEYLVKAIEARDFHLSTGFLATPYLLPILSEYGRSDLAYEILLQEDNPSWLYAVNQGATTIWERWDGIKEDGSLQSWRMNSFNHYAYGIVGLWFYHHH